MASRTFGAWGDNYFCVMNAYMDGGMSFEPVSFTHNPDNAAQARIQWNTWVEYKYRYTDWENPGGPAFSTAIFVQSGLNAGASHTQFSYPRWDGCNNDDRRGPAGNSSWVETIDASISSTTMKQRMHVNSWDDNQDTAFRDQVVTHYLSDNFRILPPTGFKAYMKGFNENTVKVQAKIDSWSNNPNIHGTPYTSGGGRDWNWRCIISQQDGTEVARIEKDTGETKTVLFEFEDLALPEGTYKVQVTCSNEFQQTASTTLNKRFYKWVGIYGSHEDESTDLHKLYMKLDGEKAGTLVKKIYASVDGETKLVHQNWNWNDETRPKARAVWDANGAGAGKGVLTYYYDTEEHDDKDDVWVIDYYLDAGWKTLPFDDEVIDSLEKLVFDESFEDAPITNCSYLFREFRDTPVIDATHLVTTNVTNMDYMFSGRSLPSLPTMVALDTSKVTSMKSMFENVRRITNLDLSSLDMSNVKDTSNMLSGCRFLEELTLGTPEIGSLSIARGMFANCPALEHIYSGTDFSSSTVLLHSENMFEGDELLPNFDPGVVDKTNANTSATGYFEPLP